MVVELRAAALNRRDIFVRKGIAPSPLPIILGSDGAGVIRSLGDGVRGVAEGDEVIVFPSLGWGAGEAAPAPGFRILGGPDDGTYAELLKVPAENVFPRPQRLSWEESAALPLAGLTAWRALVSRAGMRPGETVLILGIGGGVATFALHIARAAGCRVIVTSSSDEKLARAAEMGADAGVNYTEGDWVAEVKERSRRRRGHRGRLGRLHLGRQHQRGAPGRPGGGLRRHRRRQAAAHGASGHAGNVSLLGTTMGSARDFAGLLAAVRTQSWAPVIDSVRPLAEAADAHAREEAGEHFGKLVLTMPLTWARRWPPGRSRCCAPRWARAPRPGGRTPAWPPTPSPRWSTATRPARTALAEALEERRRLDPLGPGAREDPGPRERRAARRWEARQAIGRLVLAGELAPDGPDRVVLPGFGASTWRAIALLWEDPGSDRAWAEAVAAEPLADLGEAAPADLRDVPTGGPLAEEAAALHALEALRQDLRHALIGAEGSMGLAMERGLTSGADALAAECAGLTEHLEALDREIARAWDEGARAAVRYARPG